MITASMLTGLAKSVVVVVALLAALTLTVGSLLADRH
jgi:hypothetical protein